MKRSPNGKRVSGESARKNEKERRGERNEKDGGKRNTEERTHEHPHTYTNNLKR